MRTVMSVKNWVNVNRKEFTQTIFSEELIANKTLRDKLKTKQGYANDTIF